MWRWRRSANCTVMANAKERPAHGVIYYELGQGEASQFHTLDADEYWFFHAGSTLELWKSTTPS